MVLKLVVVLVEVGDVILIEFFYKKKSGFLFWGGGVKSIEVVFVFVMFGEKFIFVFIYSKLIYEKFNKLMCMCICCFVIKLNILKIYYNMVCVCYFEL